MNRDKIIELIQEIESIAISYDHSTTSIVTSEAGMDSMIKAVQRFFPETENPQIDLTKPQVISGDVLVEVSNDGKNWEKAYLFIITSEWFAHRFLVWCGGVTAEEQDYDITEKTEYYKYCRFPQPEVKETITLEVTPEQKKKIEEILGEK